MIVQEEILRVSWFTFNNDILLTIIKTIRIILFMS